METEAEYREEERKHITQIVKIRGGFSKFIVEEIEDPQPPLEKGDIIVTCQRGGCMKAHVVNKHQWILASNLQSRSCPYCYKASAMPLMTMIPSEDLVDVDLFTEVE